MLAGDVLDLNRKFTYLPTRTTIRTYRFIRKDGIVATRQAQTKTIADAVDYQVKFKLHILLIIGKIFQRSSYFDTVN